MKKIILLFAILISALQLKSQVLGVNLVTQEQTQWCWSGVSACVLNYYCTTTEQCVIAEYTRTVATWHDFGSTDCCVNPNLGCNYWNYNWGYPGSIQDILIHFASISNDGISSSLSQPEITSDIQNNRLFIIRWGWNSGGGHFIVGHGMIDNDLYYMDPWYGEGLKVADYSWVCSGGDHTWTHTNRLSITPPSSLPEAAGTITGLSTVCQGQNGVNYTVPEIPGVTSYVWTLPPGATGSSTSNSITVDYDSNAMSGKVTVCGSSSCGNGPPSVLPVTVYIVPAAPVISLTGNILHSDAASGNQWYNLDGIINGATGQDYTVLSNGDYYDIVTLGGGCSSASSDTLHVILSGIGAVDENRLIKVYPNPVTDELTIEIERNSENLKFEILNPFGQAVYKGIFIDKTTVTTSGFAPGIYVIRFENGKSFDYRKIVRE